MAIKLMSDSKASKNVLEAPNGKGLGTMVGAAARAAKGTASASQGTLFGYFALAGDTPGGPALFTYTAAVLRAIGALDGSPFRTALLTAFYRSDAVVRQHKGKGNLEVAGGGMLRVTKTGLAYFGGRESGASATQQVVTSDADIVADALRTGKLAQSIPGKIGAPYASGFRAI